MLFPLLTLLTTVTALQPTLANAMQKNEASSTASPNPSEAAASTGSPTDASQQTVLVLEPYNQGMKPETLATKLASTPGIEELWGLQALAALPALEGTPLTTLGLSLSSGLTAPYYPIHKLQTKPKHLVLTPLAMRPKEILDMTGGLKSTAETGTLIFWVLPNNKEIPVWLEKSDAIQVPGIGANESLYLLKPDAFDNPELKEAAERTQAKMALRDTLPPRPTHAATPSVKKDTSCTVQ